MSRKRFVYLFTKPINHAQHLHTTPHSTCLCCEIPLSSYSERMEGKTASIHCRHHSAKGGPRNPTQTAPDKQHARPHSYSYWPATAPIPCCCWSPDQQLNSYYFQQIKESSFVVLTFVNLFVTINHR